MVSRLCDQNSIALNFVNESMFVVDSSRPVATQCMPEGFGFSGSFKRGSNHLLDEVVDPLEQLPDPDFEANRVAEGGVLPFFHLQLVWPSVPGQIGGSWMPTSLPSGTRPYQTGEERAEGMKPPISRRASERPALPRNTPSLRCRMHFNLATCYVSMIRVTRNSDKDS